MTKLTINGEDGIKRCGWCGNDSQYVRYHDTEWGMPVDNDRRLFEKVCLEGFQAGLSWLTILRKREAFRGGFANFEFNKVSKFTQRDVSRLMNDASIVRHRGKIESTINNAKQAIKMKKEFGSLTEFFWQYQPKRSRVIRRNADVPAKTEDSTALSQELKKRGWSFVGPTTAYAFMQSVGIVNDHAVNCESYEECKQARAEFLADR
ncbi:MAG: DNA-3-methyladenine glycosylase I [Mariniblastus sp.]|jgi:DNA-3-methyladenine glycosylase I